jgi:hypothetical protein
MRTVSMTFDEYEEDKADSYCNGYNEACSDLLKAITSNDTLNEALSEAENEGLASKQVLRKLCELLIKKAA